MSIVLATINCIEKRGFKAVTIREIAHAAHVNSAAISYYFGSKEKLIEKALRRTVDNYFEDLYAMLKKEYPSARALFKEMLEYTLEGGLKFPNITKAHLYDPFLFNDYHAPFVTEFNSVLNKLSIKASRLDREKNIREMKLRILPMYSAVMIVCLLPDFFRSFINIDFRDAAEQKTYVSRLLKAFFGE